MSSRGSAEERPTRTRSDWFMPTALECVNPLHADAMSHQRFRRDSPYDTAACAIRGIHDKGQESREAKARVVKMSVVSGQVERARREVSGRVCMPLADPFSAAAPICVEGPLVSEFQIPHESGRSMYCLRARRSGICDTQSASSLDTEECSTRLSCASVARSDGPDGFTDALLYEYARSPQHSGHSGSGGGIGDAVMSKTRLWSNGRGKGSSGRRPTTRWSPVHL